MILVYISLRSHLVNLYEILDSYVFICLYNSTHFVKIDYHISDDPTSL